MRRGRKSPWLQRGRLPVYQRERLRPGDRLRGPAVIAEYSATAFVEAGFRADVDAWENVIVKNEK